MKKLGHRFWPLQYMHRLLQACGVCEQGVSRDFKIFLLCL